MWLGTVLIHTLLIYCRSVFLQRTFSSLSEICHKLSLCRGYRIGFFNPVIPTQHFVKSRNAEGYFWHPTSQAYFQSRDSPRFYFQIPNPEFYDSVQGNVVWKQRWRGVLSLIVISVFNWRKEAIHILTFIQAISS